MFKNSFWYVIVMLSGIAYGYFFDLDRILWVIGLPIWGLFMFWMVSRLRQWWRL